MDRTQFEAVDIIDRKQEGLYGRSYMNMYVQNGEPRPFSAPSLTGDYNGAAAHGGTLVRGFNDAADSCRWRGFGGNEKGPLARP